MQDGSMFADLVKYADESFSKQHKEILFDTIFKSYKYEIIAVFKTVDKTLNAAPRAKIMTEKLKDKSEQSSGVSQQSEMSMRLINMKQV